MQNDRLLNLKRGNFSKNKYETLSLQEMLNKCVDFGKEYGLKFNKTKTQFVIRNIPIAKPKHCLREHHYDTTERTQAPWIPMGNPKKASHVEQALEFADIGPMGNNVIRPHLVWDQMDTSCYHLDNRKEYNHP